MADRPRRIALNEALFREVNERVEAVNQQFGERAADAQFVCECGDDRCIERIQLTLDDYESLRSDATHFAVRTGHEIPDVERVVAERDGYLVVAKTGFEQSLAEETDPRS